jgi:hypothetical protein
MADVGFSISGIPGAPLGPTLRITTTSPFLHGRFDAVDQFKLAIKHAGRAFKAGAFFTGDLGNAAAFGKVSVKDL